MARTSFMRTQTTLLLCLASLAHTIPRTHGAFTPTFSSSTTQCGTFTVSWTSTSTNRAGPPFSLLLVPVNDATSPAPDTSGRGGQALSKPVVYLQSIPESAWNVGTNSGTYTIEQLPLRTGERFVVVMDDGFGDGTGGVSPIQTVGGSASAPTSCLTSVQQSDVLFQLSTYTPAQCSPMTITTGQAKAIRGFVPGGNAVSLELPTASTGNMTTKWNVNAPSGTPFVLLYIGKDGQRASSGLMVSHLDSTSTSECLIPTGPHTTDAASPSSTSSSSGSSTSLGSGTKPASTATGSGTVAPSTSVGSSGSNNGGVTTGIDSRNLSIFIAGLAMSAVALLI